MSSASSSPAAGPPPGIAQRQFASARRGYDPREVQAYLGELAALIEQLQRSEAAQRARADEAEARARAGHTEQLDEQRLIELLGEETARILEVARTAAGEIRRKAEESAARLISEANDESHRLRTEASDEAHRVRAEATSQADRMRAEASTEADRLRGEATDEADRLRTEATRDADRLRAEAEAAIAAQRIELRNEIETMQREAAAEVARRRAAAEAEVAEMRRSAEAFATETRRDAEAFATRTRGEAESFAAGVRGEAEEMQQEAATELSRRRAEGEALVAGLRREAEDEGEALRTAARDEGRKLVAEAQIVRERMLRDLGRRRRLAREQLERLNAARERLLSAYDVVRRTIDAATGELTVALPEAKVAAEAAMRRVSGEPEPTVEELDDMVAMARIAGLLEPRLEPSVFDDDDEPEDDGEASSSASETPAFEPVAEQPFGTQEPGTAAPDRRSPSRAEADVDGDEQAEVDDVVEVTAVEVTEVDVAEVTAPGGDAFSALREIAEHEPDELPEDEIEVLSDTSPPSAAALGIRPSTIRDTAFYEIPPPPDAARPRHEPHREPVPPVDRPAADPPTIRRSTVDPHPPSPPFDQASPPSPRAFDHDELSVDADNDPKADPTGPGPASSRPAAWSGVEGAGGSAQPVSQPSEEASTSPASRPASEPDELSMDDDDPSTFPFVEESAGDDLAGGWDEDLVGAEDEQDELGEEDGSGDRSAGTAGPDAGERSGAGVASVGPSREKPRQRVGGREASVVDELFAQLRAGRDRDADDESATEDDYDEAGSDDATGLGDGGSLGRWEVPHLLEPSVTNGAHRLGSGGEAGDDLAGRAGAEAVTGVGDDGTGQPGTGAARDDEIADDGSGLVAHRDRLARDRAGLSGEDSATSRGGAGVGGQDDEGLAGDRVGFAGDGGGFGGGGEGDEELLRRRDEVLVKAEQALARRLKRVLADEQNEVLDLLRRTKEPSKASVDELLPDVDAHVTQYATPARDDLEQVAETGAEQVVPAGGFGGSCVELAGALGRAVVEPLRERIARSLGESGPDPEELTGRLRALYREWKSHRINEAVRHFAAAAYARGAYEAVPEGTALRWVVDRSAEPCPDADDNALAGTVPRGEAFPTGDRCPPAHLGCRCLVVPAVPVDLPRSNRTTGRSATTTGGVGLTVTSPS